MASNLDEIERVFGSIDREVWIVTAGDASRRGGLVATWVSQASIDREHPLVLIGIAPNHFTAELIDASGGFGLHLISADQVHHAWNFGIGSGRERDKFKRVAIAPIEAASPILDDCLSWLDCRVFAAERTGDRTFYWADVVAGGAVSEGSPLTESQLIQLATDEQKQLLRAGRDADIVIQRPLQAAWRADLPRSLRLK
ncbi:MAG: flavin reductase family protein [Planctomycetaceae bacterium]|nr:flavin reductase family protein [Planctomycetaceae bacterium]MCB9937309.1 flavin reductase family protein [Planctomycetaceae bacterium]